MLIEYIPEKKPFSWSSQDKSHYIDLSQNSTEIHYSGRSQDYVDENVIGPMVRAERPFPKNKREGQLGFEVLIVNAGRNNEIAVGISAKSVPLDRFPGWERYSFGYHGDDGNIYLETDYNRIYLENEFDDNTDTPYETGDTIGLCLDFSNAGLSFSKNGKVVKNVKLSRQQMDQEYYASVGISSPGGIVRAVNMSIDGKLILPF